MTCKDIVVEYLKTHGYDGLGLPGECACLLEDLWPCTDVTWNDCEPGYKMAASAEMLEEYPDCDWMVGPEKPEEATDADS